jgi:glycosyltransferase involved in cell wall biosynthesis
VTLLTEAGEHVLLFDLTHQAHVLSFLRHWLLWWERHRPAGRLSVVVDPYLLKRQPELVALGRRCGEGVRLVAITAGEKQDRKRVYAGRERQEWPLHRLLRSGSGEEYPPLFDWTLFCTYARRERATHAVMARLDPFLPLLAAGHATPERFSGISFCATFPGRRLRDPSDGSAPRPQPGDAFLLARGLRHPHLDTLFLNDAEWVGPLRSYPCAQRVVHLPEVAELNGGDEPAAEALRNELGALQCRVVFLVFGDLAPRKGVMTALAAMARLPADQQRRAALVIAGRSYQTSFQAQISAAANDLRERTAVAVLELHRFITEVEVAALFARADVVLTLYRGHAGMSNVILLAAAAERPVLSCREGRMGQMVDRERLGLTIEVGDLEAVAAAMVHCLEAAPGTLGDAASMRRLAARHTGESFAGTFFRRLGLGDPSP